MTPPAPRRGPPDRGEIEGFLEGVTHRLRGLPEPPRRDLEADLGRAREAFALGALVETERILLDLEVRADAIEGEPELSEWPRGLVGYVPKGERGHATSDEEDPLSNRLRLIGRLAAVRRSQGRDVSRAEALLGEADAALRAGDRRSARRRVDEAHALLEVEPRSPSEE